MIKLKSNQFDFATPLFSEMAAWNVYVTAVLQQKSPGRVYVDNLDNPSSGFAISLDCAYLVGQPDNTAFNKALKSEIEATLLAGDRVNPDDPKLTICVDSQHWEPVLAELLVDWRWPPIWGDNQHLLFKAPRLNWLKALPAGYKITQLDAKLLAKQGDGLPKNIADSIRIGWGDAQNFLQNGFGFVALQGEAIVCWCLADVTVANQCEIGIETAPEHRQKGLATAVTAATLEYCRKNGYTHIGWHCGSDNPASIGTAKKVGFVLERPYNFYEFHYDEPNHYAELGRFYFEAKMYDEAADMLEIAIEVDEDPPSYVYFLGARALAHLEEPVAVEYLQEAVATGFKDWALLNSLPEFTSYQNDPNFPTKGLKNGRKNS